MNTASRRIKKGTISNLSKYSLTSPCITAKRIRSPFIPNPSRRPIRSSGILFPESPVPYALNSGLFFLSRAFKKKAIQTPKKAKYMIAVLHTSEEKSNALPMIDKTMNINNCPAANST